jgi:hypothetical protein
LANVFGMRFIPYTGSGELPEPASVASNRIRNELVLLNLLLAFPKILASWNSCSLQRGEVADWNILELILGQQFAGFGYLTARVESSAPEPLRQR